MTKSQVVAHLAEKAEISKKAVVALLEELVSLATKEAKSGGQFVIPGLGKSGQGESQRLAQVCNLSDGRSHQDSGQNGSEIPFGQGIQRCRRAAKEEVALTQQSEFT